MTKIIEITSTRYFKIILAVLVVVVLGGVLVSKRTKSSQVSSNNTLADESLQTLPLNHSFEIPLGTDSDKHITFKLVDAQIKDAIILKGQRATSVDGKQFLVVNIKLTNNHEQRIKIDTRDYVRLSVNGTEDKLAPQIHNDPVEVQPISDQYTRLGFSIFKTDTDLKLIVGPVSGEKIEIPLSFTE